MSALTHLQMDESPPGPLSDNQSQTKSAFGFQWQMRAAFESEAVQAQTRRWLIERYCSGDPERLSAWLVGGRKFIVDAGCGAGLSALAFFGDHLNEHDYLGIDIAGEAIGTARDRFHERGVKADFLEASVSDVPLADGSVDIVFSEGVLHHTDNTEAAFQHLAGKLKAGGRFLFYVYARKAVLREFADDYVRDSLNGLSDEEAWEALKPLTKLGEALGRLGVTIDVPEDIPFLGIQRGSMDVQRFFYWNVCKLFYRPDFTLDEMNHINFDWYRPLNCHRHTPEEVISWCEHAGLSIEHLDIQEAGISVVAKKQ